MRGRRILSAVPAFSGGSGAGQAFPGAFRDQVAFDLGEESEQGGHHLGLYVLLSLDAEILLDRDDGDPLLDQLIQQAHNLPEGAAEAGEFADDQAIARRLLPPIQKSLHWT